nr:oligosaccharide flippase family protein [Lachnospiraceae bacterium]
MSLMNNMLQRYRSFPVEFKATIWFTIANIVLKGISFFSVPLLTRVLPQEDYGVVSVFFSYQQLILIFATFEFYLGAFQRGIIHYEKEEREFTSNLIFLCNLITIIVFFVLLPFRDNFITLTKTSNAVYVLMFIYFIVYPAFNCWLNKKRYEYAYKPAVSATLITTFLITIGSIVFTIILGQDDDTYLIIILTIQILCYFPFYIKQISALHIRNRMIEHFRYCMSFQLPLVAHSLSYLILAQADRVMISWMSGDDKAAIYSVAYSLSSAILIVQNSINQVFQPWRYKKLKNREYGSIKNVTNKILILTAVSITLFIILIPEIMRFMFDEIYY